MAINRSTEYPGRFGNPDSSYPQGKFINRSAAGVEDGSYIDEKWLNDQDGFLQALLHRAGITPSGVPDTAINSDYFNAANALWDGKNKSVGTTAELRALDASVGLNVLRTGYYESGDGGGAPYIIEERDGSSDDGGSVIFLDNGLQARLVTSSTISLSQFGAEVGGNDITPSFTAAINFLKNYHADGSGGVIILPDGDIYGNITVPYDNIKVYGGGIGVTRLRPYDVNATALTIKKDPDDVISAGYDFLLRCDIDDFSVERVSDADSVYTPLVELHRYRYANYNIEINGRLNKGTGLKVVDPFEVTFHKSIIRENTIGIDHADGPQADSLEFPNVLLQQNKLGVVGCRSRRPNEPVTPDQNAGCSNIKFSGKILGEQGSTFISNHSCLQETTATNTNADAYTVNVADATGFKVDEFIVVGTGVDLQFGMITSVDGLIVTIDRTITYTTGDDVVQARFGFINCHNRAISFDSTQLEGYDIGVFVASGEILAARNISLSSVVKPFYIAAGLRRFVLDGVIGGTSGSGDWQLITTRGSFGGSHLAVTLKDCFLESSSYYAYSGSDPRITPDNFMDVRDTGAKILYRYTEPNIVEYSRAYGGLGNRGITNNANGGADWVDRFYSKGRDYWRQLFHSSSDTNAAITDIFDVSEKKFKTTRIGDNWPYMEFGLGSDIDTANESTRYIRVGGGKWDDKPLVLGNYYIWFDTNGKMRVKSGAPVSEADGTIVGTQS